MGHVKRTSDNVCTCYLTVRNTSVFKQFTDLSKRAFWSRLFVLFFLHVTKVILSSYKYYCHPTSNTVILQVLLPSYK